MSTEPARVSPFRVSLRAVPGGLPLGAILGALTAAGALAVHLLHLDRLGFTVCTFKALTGRPCLTCGGTRAMARLAALDLPGALAMNPLVTVGALVLLAWAVADAALWMRGKSLALELGARAARLLAWIVVPLLLANWVYLLAVGR